MDSDLGEYLGDLQRDVISRLACTFLVNGFKCEARPTLTQPNRVQMYIAEEEWQQPVYDLVFVDDVRQRPWNLKNGAAVTWVQFGRRFVVRRVTEQAGGDELWLVGAIVVETSR